MNGFVDIFFYDNYRLGKVFYNYQKNSFKRVVCGYLVCCMIIGFLMVLIFRFFFFLGFCLREFYFLEVKVEQEMKCYYINSWVNF